MTNSPSGICLVLVTYNRVEVLRNTLKQIDLLTLQPEKIIIVDNNSTDDTQLFLQSYKDNEQYDILLLKHNSGYGAGLNNGIAYASSKKKYNYYWMMDDDSFPEPDSLSMLISNIEKQQYDLLGSKGYNVKFGQPKLLLQKEEAQIADVILVDGALVKGEVIEKVGPPSDIFFMMCEDYEFCKRVKRNGFKIGCISQNLSQRLHLGGGEKFSKNTLWRGYYHSRNHLLILRKYFTIEDMLGYVLRQSKYLVAALKAPDRFRRIKFRLLGILHGIQNKKGKTLDPATLTFIK